METEIKEILTKLKDTDMFNGQYSWGSCQYETAAATFAALREIEDLSSFDRTLEIMGITFTFDKIRDIEDIVSSIRSELLQDINPPADVKETMREQFPDWTEEQREKYLQSSIEFAREQLQDFDQADTSDVDGILNAFKDMAYDLWGAAPFILEHAFDNGNLELEDEPKLMTAGPILNLMSQSDNYRTGVICYLLFHYFGATDFGGYDT